MDGENQKIKGIGSYKIVGEIHGESMDHLE